MDGHFKLEIDGARATITLDNPPVKNRLLASDLPGLNDILAKIENDADIRVAVLRATGEHAFCSGYAVGDIGDTDWEKNPLEEVCDRLEALPMPTICALNGNVYGGAVDLTLTCDFRIGVPGMNLAIPAVRLGVHYWPNGLSRHVERLGLGLAKRLFLAQETFTGEQLLDLGYLDYLAPLDELAARTDELAAKLAGHAPLPMRGMKRALNQVARGNLDIEATKAAILECMSSEDAREGPRAFAEKRAPVFKGR
ncbi:MAG: enoyl-CoA hydratase/isomerase family protein [Alphaproteobacteria bacterium]